MNQLLRVAYKNRVSSAHFVLPFICLFPLFGHSVISVCSLFSVFQSSSFAPSFLSFFTSSMEEEDENVAYEDGPNSVPVPSGFRVLVVDDSPPCLRIIERILTSFEYLVTTCDSGEAALALLRDRKEDFDIVVTDVHMPNMDGFMLLEHIRLEIDLPVVLLSVDSEPSMMLRGLREGAVFYYTKPAKVSDLKHIWQHVVWWKGTKEIVEIEQSTCVSVNVKENGNSRNEEECTSKMKKKEKTIRKAKRKLTDFREEEGETSGKKKRSRIVWNPDLHSKFMNAIKRIGYERAVPKTIHGLMNVPGLSRENVASHLQKFRLYVKKHEHDETGPEENMEEEHNKDDDRRGSNTRNQNNLANSPAETTTRRRTSNSGSRAPSNVTQASRFLFGSGSNARTTNQENLVTPPFSGSYLLGSSSNIPMPNQENLVRPVMSGSCLFGSGANTQIPNHGNLVRPVMSSSYPLSTQIPNQENLARPLMPSSYPLGTQIPNQENLVRPVMPSSYPLGSSHNARIPNQENLARPLMPSSYPLGIQMPNQENLARPVMPSSYPLGSSHNARIPNQENLARPLMPSSYPLGIQMPNQENLARPVMPSSYPLGSSHNTQILHQENLVRPAMPGSYSHGSGFNNQMHHRGNRVRPVVSMANGVFTMSNFQGSNNQSSMEGNVGSVGRETSRPRHSIYDVGLPLPTTTGPSISTQRSWGANSNFTGLLSQMDMQAKSSRVLAQRDMQTNPNRRFPQMDMQTNSHGVLPQRDLQMNSSGILPQMGMQMNSSGVLPQRDAQVNSNGILPQMGVQMNSSGVLPQRDAQVNSNGILPQMGVQMNSSGVLPQRDARVNSNGILPQIGVQMNSSGVLPQIGVQMNSSGVLPQTDMQMNSNRFFPQTDVQMNSHGGVLPHMDMQMNSNRLFQQMDVQMNSLGGVLPHMDMQMNSNGLFQQMDMQMNSHGVLPQMDMQVNSHRILPQMGTQMNVNGVPPQMNMQMNSIASTGFRDAGISSLNPFWGTSQYPNNNNGRFQQDHNLDRGINATGGVANQPRSSTVFTPSFSLPPAVQPHTSTAPPIDNQFRNTLSGTIPVDNEVLWRTSSYEVEGPSPGPFALETLNVSNKFGFDSVEESITNEISNLNISGMDHLGRPASQFDLTDPFANGFTQLLQEAIEGVGGTEIDDFPTEAVPSRFSDDDIRDMTNP